MKRKRDHLNKFLDKLYLEGWNLDEFTVKHIRDAFHIGWDRGHLQGYSEGYDERTAEESWE